MKLNVINETPNTIRFVWDGVGLRVGNVVRRAAMADIPSLAIEEVQIYENTSVFFDEYLSHRLGLVALKADVSKFKSDERITFTIDKAGPGFVHGSDLRSSSKDVEVIGKDVPIIKLKEGQKLRLEAIATIGNGETHAKWQPGLITYQGYPKLSYDAEKCENPKEVVESCPTNVLELKNNKVVLKDPINCTLCGQCQDTATDGVKIVPEDDKIIFYIESFGQIAPKDMIKQATQYLINKAEDFRKQLKKAK